MNYSNLLQFSSLDSMSVEELTELRSAVDRRLKKPKGRKILALYSPYPSAGKTTIARWLVYTLKYFDKIVSFAQPLRDMVNVLWSYQGDHQVFDYNTCKDTPIHEYADDTPRDIICTLGKALREKYGQAYFANLGEYTIKQCDPENIVIDDLRLPEEYAMVRTLGAKVVLITVPGKPIVRSDTEGRLEGMDFDVHIVNAMEGKDSLYQAVAQAVYKLWEE